MGQISVSLPADGETIEAADYNAPITTIVNEINGSLNNANIATNAAIAGTKLASSALFDREVNDTAGNEVLQFAATASAVNELTITNAATGSGPTISATGGDTNVDINMTPKGTGKLKVGGNPVDTGEWTSWTPTYNNISGGTVEFAEYTQIGKTVHFKINRTVTSVSGDVTITLPVTAPAATNTATPIGTVLFTDNGAAVYTGVVTQESTSTMKLRAIAAGGTYASTANVSSSVPFSWGSGDLISLHGTYEAA